MFSSDFHINRPEWVPEEVYRNAILGLHERKVEQARVIHAYWKGLQELKKEHLGNINELLGPNNVKQYRLIRKKRSERFRALLSKSDRTDTGSEAMERERRKVVEKYKEEFGQLTVDASSFTNWKEMLRKKQNNLRVKTLVAAGVAPDIISPEDDGPFIPLADDATLAHAVYGPPYDAWGYFWRYEYSDEAIHPEWWQCQETQTGRVGMRSYIEVADADDWDFSQVEMDSAIGVWYKVPQDGRIWVTAEFINRSTGHQWGHTYNEASWSWNEVIQRVFFYYHKTDSRGLTGMPHAMEFLVNDGFIDDEKTWNYKIPSVPGAEYWPGYFSPHQVQEGEIFLMWFGLGCENSFWSDDYEITSGLTHDFIISRIEIGIY